MDRDLETERQVAVRRYFGGESVRSIALSLRRSEKWVRKWVERVIERNGDWFQAESRRPHRVTGRTTKRVEQIIVSVRQELENAGLFCGAQSILWELESRGEQELPTARTIARILKRNGVVGRRRQGYEAKGKRYPGPERQGLSSIHQSDFVGPRYGRGALRFYSLNTVELSTGRCAVQPLLVRDAQNTIDAVWASWQRLGIPRLQQLDNESVFFGSVKHPRGMGAVIRLCLLHDVEPWFIPMGEPWRNGVVEKFNDFYGQKFLRTTEVDSVPSLLRESQRFEERHNSRHRYSKLNGRTPLEALQASALALRFPPSVESPRHPLPRPQTGRYHALRFVRSNGIVDLFGERFRAPPAAHHEYVRLTVNVEKQTMGLFLNDVLLEQHAYPTR